MIDWEYSGPRGPERWADIREEYRPCREGCCQSPVDLSSPVESDETAPEFDYYPFSPEVSNTGWNASVIPPSGMTMKMGGKVFELIEFHFHVPGEHTVEGKEFHGEMHFVHSCRETGKLAVAAILFSQGDRNYELDKIWSAIPEKPGHTRKSKWSLNPAKLLPAERECYLYSGSLTRPPCTEGVTWIVFSHPLEMSVEQGRSFLSVIGPNSRPVQPIGTRDIKLIR